jgi:predicted PurR-regulated permease PerM
MKEFSRLPFYVKLALNLLALTLVVMMLILGKNIFVPLVLSLLVAMLMYPLNRFLEKKLHFARGLAVTICILIFMVTLVGFVFFIGQQISVFADDAPELQIRFQKIFADMQHWFSATFHVNRTQQNTYLNESTSNLAQSVTSVVTNLLSSLSGILLLFVFVFIYTFFILYYRLLLIRFLLHLFSPQHRPKVQEVIMEGKLMINGYIGGLLIEMLLVGAVNCILLLTLGVKYAILLGIIAAVLNIIPYIGFYSSIVLTVIVTFANSSLNHALEAGIGLFVVHLIDSNILLPRIVGARVKMNPFVTILAVVIGEYIWGISGMFLFIPITAILKLICERTPGLEAWAILIGVEEKEKKVKKVAIATTNAEDKVDN